MQNEREWEAFCRVVLERPELATDARFVTNSLRAKSREELTQIITDVFSALTIDQVVERLERAQIANARMNDMRDVWNHPQLKARERWTSVSSPVGVIPALLPPGLPNAFEPRMDAIPALGEHSEGILRELGYTADDVSRLRTEGAI